MKLRQLDYKKQSLKKNNNEWSVDDLLLMDTNLIVGQNATGKSRVLRLIDKVASIINGLPVDDSFNGAVSNTFWQLHFQKANGDTFKYTFSSTTGLFPSEKMYFNEQLVLERTNDGTYIFSNTLNKRIEIAPPLDKLTLHIRRDQIEFPFFEDIAQWAKQVRFFDFTAIDPIDKLSKSLDYHPVHLLEKLNTTSKSRVISELNEIGYNVKDIFVQKLLAPRLRVVEEGLNAPLIDSEMSQGMLRALALLVFIENVVANNHVSTVLVDDLGEGLDYERATKLGKLLVEKLKNSNIQFVATTNDEFLMNIFDTKFWNILQKEGNTIKSLNHINSKKIFDDFRMSGLSNFYLLSSNFLSLKQL